MAGQLAASSGSSGFELFVVAVLFLAVVGLIAWINGKESRNAPTLRKGAKSTSNQVPSDAVPHVNLDALQRSSSIQGKFDPEPPPEPERRKMAQLISDLGGGTRFADQWARGQLPPDGPAFVNRFLHAHPAEWQEEWMASGLAGVGLSTVLSNIDQLCTTVLDPIQARGASLPYLGAAEEAVTVNLTALAVALARNILSNNPQWRTGSPIASQGWTSDPSVNDLALQIRSMVESADFQLLNDSNSRFHQRPGDSVRVVVRAMVASADGVKSNPFQRGSRSFEEILGDTFLQSLPILEAIRRVQGGDLSLKPDDLH